MKQVRGFPIKNAILGELGILASLVVSFWILIISVIASAFRFVEVAKEFRSKPAKAVAIGLTVEVAVMVLLTFLFAVLFGGLAIYLGWAGILVLGVGIAVLSRILAVKWLERFL